MHIIAIISCSSQRSCAGTAIVFVKVCFLFIIIIIIIVFFSLKSLSSPKCKLPNISSTSYVYMFGHITHVRIICNVHYIIIITNFTIETWFIWIMYKMLLSQMDTFELDKLYKGII